MADISLIASVVKARAKRVFAAIDDGASELLVRQHKLRQATQKKLIYFWRPHCRRMGKTPAEFRAFIEVKRDSLGRLYLKEIPSLPDHGEAWNELQKHPEKWIKV